MSPVEAVTIRNLNIDLSGRFAFEDNPAPAYGSNAMEFSGTVADVFEGLVPAMEGEPLTDSYWFAPRLMRAVLDNKRPLGEVGHIEAINQTTALTAELFAGQPNPERLEIVRDHLGRAGLMQAHVEQEDDPMTGHGTTPERTYNAALSAVIERPDSDLLFTPLCHGGFAAGVQTALYAQRIEKQFDVMVHPIRFSRTKMKDGRPHLTLPEHKHLKEIGKNASLVIFDEDSFTGITIAEAMRGLSDIGTGQPFCIAAYDKRQPRFKARQGEHWEHTPTLYKFSETD